MPLSGPSSTCQSQACSHQGGEVGPWVQNRAKKFGEELRALRDARREILGKRELLFPATVERRVTRGWTRLEAWPEGGLGLKGVAYDAGGLTLERRGYGSPGWSRDPKRPTHSLKLSTAPAFISSVLRRENEVTWAAPRTSNPSYPSLWPP